MKKYYACPIMESFVIRQEDIITDSQNDDIIGDDWGTIDPEIFS